MDEHYEKPEWLKGTAWEVLSNEYGGKFSMFLEAAELSGFKPILDGKSVATVMAPDNDAFAAYLEEHGYVNDFSETRRHHEIYLSDPRKVPRERMKTVIRHPVSQNSIND